jgi:hypothetical protein
MKNFLLFVFIIASFTANAQIEVYNHNFNTDGVEGWTIVDQDANGATWTLKNNEYNTIMGSGTAFNVLNLPNSEMNGAPKSDWAILPVQDMSFYNGVKLNFTYLKGFFETENTDYIKIYAGVTANIEEMLAAGPIATVTLEGDNVTEPPAPIVKTVDIPAAWNVPNVYFAIAHVRTTGDLPSSNYIIELTQVSLTAENIAGLDGINKTATILKQNPVTETLEFQFGTNVNIDTANITIYNSNGMLVKEAKYSKAGISVADLASGMYFATLTNGAVTEQIKFIKK